MRNNFSFIQLGIALWLGSVTLTHAQGTAFTYQGRLTDIGASAKGNYGMVFYLCDTPDSGGQLANLGIVDVPVSNGVFTVTLDFGANFPGADRWLEITLKTNGAASFTTLSPRQKLTPTPYAIHAGNARTFDGHGTNDFAPATGSANYVAKSGDTMSGRLNLPANGLTVGGNQLVLSGGNVGIGTTSPNLSKLNVVNASSAESSIAGISLGTPAFPVGVTLGWRDNNHGWIQSWNSTPLYINALGNNVVFNRDGGNVGIGATSPGYQLDLGGGTTINERIRVERGSDDPGQYATFGWSGIYLHRDSVPLSSTQSAFDIRQVGSDGTRTPFRVDGLGDVVVGRALRVGTGTISSEGHMNLQASKIYLQAADQIWLQPSAYKPSDEPGAVLVGGDGRAANLLVVDGNVGIGTRIPLRKLEVAESSTGEAVQLSLFNPDMTQANSSAMEFRTAQARLASIRGYVGIVGNNGGALDLRVRNGNTDAQVVGLTIRDNFMRPFSDGTADVGIGTTNPLRKLEVAESSTGEAVQLSLFNPDTTQANSSAMEFRTAQARLASIRGYVGVVGNNGGALDLRVRDGNTDAQVVGLTIRANFTDGTANVGIGTASPQAKLDVAGTVKAATLQVNGATTTGVLTITGGADVAEPFHMSEEEIPKGAVVVIDEKNPGHLKLSTRAYDKRVAGIVSGANGVNPGITLHQEGALEGSQNVALSGRVYALADASNGAIEPGDLLTTSDVPGHCMKVTDPLRAYGTVIGKAMTALPEGQGLVLVLVSPH